MHFSSGKPIDITCQYFITHVCNLFCEIEIVAMFPSRPEAYEELTEMLPNSAK